MDDTNQPVQNLQPEPQVGHGHSSKTKLLLIGLGVLFVLGLGGAYVLGMKNSQPAQNQVAVSPTALQPSPASDINWKTYTNTKYQYTIGYPDFLKHTSEIAYGVTTDKWVTSDNSYAIFVISYPDGVNSYLQFYADIKKDESISVVGQKVRKLVGTEVVSEKGTLVHIGPVKRPGQNHMLVYSSTSDLADSTGISVFDKMISSFKFIDQAQVGDMADWKTHTNSVYGYSLKYPDNWVNDNSCENCAPQPIEDISNRFIHPAGVNYPYGIQIEIVTTEGTTISLMTDVIKGYNLSDKKVEIVTLDTVSATKVSGIENDGKRKIALVFGKGKYIFQIVTKENNATVGRTIDQILASFKFAN